MTQFPPLLLEILPNNSLRGPWEIHDTASVMETPPSLPPEGKIVVIEECDYTFSQALKREPLLFSWGETTVNYTFTVRQVHALVMKKRPFFLVMTALEAQREGGGSQLFYRAQFIRFRAEDINPEGFEDARKATENLIPRFFHTEESHHPTRKDSLYTLPPYTPLPRLKMRRDATDAYLLVRDTKVSTWNKQSDGRYKRCSTFDSKAPPLE